jgi:hypothetical protein
MKSAKFTEAQNKEDKADFVDSIGQMVDYCEKVGGAIPRHEIKVPYDISDKIIDDLKAYNKSLIYEDKSLAEEMTFLNETLNDKRDKIDFLLKSIEDFNDSRRFYERKLELKK